MKRQIRILGIDDSPFTFNDKYFVLADGKTDGAGDLIIVVGV